MERLFSRSIAAGQVASGNEGCDAVKLMMHKGTVRVGVATAIPGLLESLGADPVAIFTEAGMDLDVFNDPDNVIAYAARAHLLNLCVARTGCYHFGLLLGQHGSLSSLGLIGFLAQQSPDVGSALRSLQKYFHLHSQGSRINLIVEGRWARMSYHTYEPHVEAMWILEDGAMTWVFNILRELCGSDFKPSAVSFVHGLPGDQQPYRSFFKTSISYNSMNDGLHFPSDLLKNPLNRANAELLRFLQKEVDRLQFKYHDNFLDHFERILHSIMWVRHATADEVAAMFSISSRTLNRRLKTFDTTFKEVSDKVRCQIACQILNDSRVPLAELSDLLHFSDASSFIKAFKRWTGTTPAQWRLQNIP